MSKCNIVFGFFAVVWMAVIFIFSSKPAEESNANSDAVEKVIGQITVSDFKEKSENDVENYLADWRIPIRKAAHACEYALLSILIFMALPFGWSILLRGLFSMLGSVVYGISDELHQYFIPGRTALVSDVLIDAVGALTGSLGMILLFMLIKRHKLKMNKDENK